MANQTIQRRRPMRSSSPLILLLAVSIVTPYQHSALAFTHSITRKNSLPFGTSATKKATIGRNSRILQQISSSSVETTDDTDSSDEGPLKQFDSNSNEFEEGKVVRVVSNLKAYQVPNSGFGSFDPETKEFVPAPDTGERGNKCLVIPPGLRGVVSRVYDLNDLDASQPILVKFVKGENGDEGFVPPVTFLMHFDSHEIECA